MAAFLTADTSLVLPFLSSWHESHDLARSRLRGVTRLPGHVLVETVASLTRLPRGVATRPDETVRALLRAFPDEPLVLDAEGYVDLLGRAGAGRLAGGALYDALVASTVLASGARLLTRDRRAERTYRTVGVDFEMVGDSADPVA